MVLGYVHLSMHCFYFRLVPTCKGYCFVRGHTAIYFSILFSVIDSHNQSRMYIVKPMLKQIHILEHKSIKPSMYQLKSRSTPFAVHWCHVFLYKQIEFVGTG